VVTGPPEIAGVRLLHVQHPGYSAADVMATARIVETATARVPVVVTEHAVVARIDPWERDATALVATTNADAQALRLRWPGKWVEWIPYGCPPSAPTPRKGGRPRSVAIVGEFPAAERAAQRARRSVTTLAPAQLFQD
jgi:hypothetical protein